MTHVGRILSAVLCLLAGVDSYADERPQPLVVAHRGLLRHAPENTLTNFRACLELRTGFEFDVQRTKDGHLVCIHDNTVDRTTDGTGEVSKLTLSEVKKLDAGRWFDPRFAGERVPTVEEVLKLVAEYREHVVLVAVDLKAEGVEQEVVRLAEECKVLNRLLFIGRTISEQAVRRNMFQASRKAQVAALANNAEAFPKALKDSTAGWVYVRYLPSQEEIESVRQSEKKVFIAGPTVSGRLPSNWRHAADMGVDAILTDYPLDLTETLRSQAASTKSD